MSHRRAVILAVMALVLLPLVATAQTVTGTMQGNVTERASAAGLPGVTVTIRNLDTGYERVVTTDAQGFFNAPFLPVGRYRVTTELSGMGSMSRQNVPVDLNQTTVQDFSLAPAVSETITVQADAPRINTTDGEIKQTLRAQEIMSMPAPDQSSFLRLASVFSGYQENPTGGQDNPTLSSGSSVNFNGAGTRGTTFQINGVNNDDSSENQHRQGVSLATIQSFQILTNSYSSEFGRGYGAVVLVQTKSGTNELAGEIYGYGTDAKYRTRDVLQVSLAHGNQHRYQYGATAGFPILRDRLFAFANIDRTELEGTGTATRGVFTAADLALPRLTLGNDTPANRAWQDSILKRWPNAPPNAPNVAARAYQYLQEINWPDEDNSVRFDWLMTSNNTFVARYQKTHQIRETGEAIIGENAKQDNRQSNFGLTWTGILSANTVQEARLGIGLRATNVNIGAGNDTPIVRINGTGVPVFTILGNAGAFPIIRNQRDNQFVYNISTNRWTRHTFKAGTDLRQGHLNDVSDNYSRGFWTFNASCGGVNYGTGIAAFMAGCVASYWEGFGPFNLKNDIWEANAYLQDDWRPFDNLTLNLGVRYELVGVPEEQDNKINYFYKDTHYVDPRLGFAYMPGWDRNRFVRALTGGVGKFVIRGGYGHYHGRVFQSIFSQGGANVRFNPPNALFLALSGNFAARNPQFSNSNISDPLNGWQYDPSQPLGRHSLTLIDPDLKMPETRQWNLTLERQTFWNSRLRLSYVGTLGKGLLQYDRDNLPIHPSDPRSQYKVAADWLCAGTGFVAGVNPTAACPNKVPIADNEISIRVPRVNERRPDSRYFTNLIVRNNAESWYHAGQLEWETGYHRGFSGRMTYTFSKAIDTGSEATFVGAGDTNILADNKRFKRGLSRFDTRHRFTLLGSYQLPWFRDRKDFLGAVLGGWQVSTVVRMASGTPFTLVHGGGTLDVDFDGVPDSRPVCVKPEYCSGWRITHPGDQNQVPRDAFRLPQYGDKPEDLVARNSFFKDGPESVDLGIYKRFGLPMGMSMLLRLDAFNVFNTVTWGFPITDVNSANFLRVNTTAYTPRTLQLGLRFLY